MHAFKGDLIMYIEAVYTLKKTEVPLCFSFECLLRLP